MSPVAGTCYDTPEDKRRLFPAVVIPAIYAEARAGAHDDTLHFWLANAGLDQFPHGVAQLAALHELARTGRYQAARPYNCDPLQSVAETIIDGGDCDQWAAVLLAALEVLGYTARLVTFGDELDRFAHVAVAAKTARRWYALDPKGDQAGLDFGDTDATFTVFESWNP